MIRRTEIARRLLVVFVTSLAVVGCGADDGLGRRYKVTGTVTYKGEKLAKGQISFAPDDPKGTAASGPIEDGYYTLSTLGDRDGALPGKYKVSISSKDVDMAKAEADFKAKSKGVQAPFVPKDFVVKAAKSAKSNVPAKYAAPDTSNLKAEVKEQSNSFPFELTD